MRDLGTRRHVGAFAVLLTATGTLLSGCGGDAGADSPDDAATADFCRELRDAPGAGAGADDFHAYAERLDRTGTPAALDGTAREGFAVYVGYLAGLEGDDVARVEDAGAPADVFSGDDARRVEALRAGYIELCEGAEGPDAGDGSPTPAPDATPTEGGLLDDPPR